MPLKDNARGVAVGIFLGALVNYFILGTTLRGTLLISVALVVICLVLLLIVRKQNGR